MRPSTDRSKSRVQKRQPVAAGLICCAMIPMQPGVSRTRSEHGLIQRNRSFYDLLWSGASIIEPRRFNTWPLVQSLLPGSARQLEVAPGLRPRLPIEGTQFVDISAPALIKLGGRGARVARAQVNSLPFADGAFDLVCAFDIIEHVDDDEGALAELARVAKLGGTLLISAPLHASLWTPFDEFVGHKRRYDPPDLLSKLARHHLAVERSAVFGMQPRSSRLVDIGMWWLLNHREMAMWWYNRAFMQLGLRFQKELRLTPGMIATDNVDEILLVCRRDATAT
jgi:SAM-dependent methyltransferase